MFFLINKCQILIMEITNKRSENNLSNEDYNNFLHTFKKNLF